MKKTVKSLTVLIVSAMMIICTCLCTAYAAEGDNYLQSGNMDLDVMFVLDASGSMLTSDPNKIALDAVNLFIDLTDESCGAGYVVYTEKIKASSDIVSFKDKSNLESMKKEIAGLSYDPNGDTDIALGLTNAMNTFKDKGEANGRKRAIILLSDGNTHLLNGPRTVEQSKAEMEDTLKELSKMDVPVYTIGLNYDGTLDKQETERIATATKGKAFSTKTSDDLPNVLSDIFSSIYKLEGKQLALVNGNVRIKVENSSIFYVNIIIKSNFTAEELNPKLKNPNKEDVPIEGNENVKMTSAGTYTLIKLIYPMTGDWKLHIDNATEENCRITQLDFYSVYIKQTLDDKAGVNRPYQIQATLNEGDVAVRDFALLNTINMVSTITTEDGEEQVELTCDENGVFVGQFIPKKTGEITIQTKAVTKTFEKDSVTTLKLSNGAQNTLTIPAGKQAVRLTFYSYVNAASTANIDCGWQEVNGVTYDYASVPMTAFTDQTRTEEGVDGEGNPTTTQVKDIASNVDVRVFDLNKAEGQITFTNKGTQICFVAVLELATADTELDPVVTAISDVKLANRQAERYNLSGQKVSNGYRGIAIENGRKIIVK